MLNTSHFVAVMKVHHRTLYFMSRAHQETPKTPQINITKITNSNDQGSCVKASQGESFLQSAHNLTSNTKSAANKVPAFNQPLSSVENKKTSFLSALLHYSSINFHTDVSEANLISEIYSNAHAFSPSSKQEHISQTNKKSPKENAPLQNKSEDILSKKHGDPLENKGPIYEKSIQVSVKSEKDLDYVKPESVYELPDEQALIREKDLAMIANIKHIREQARQALLYPEIQNAKSHESNANDFSDHIYEQVHFTHKSSQEARSTPTDVIYEKTLPSSRNKERPPLESNNEITQARINKEYSASFVYDEASIYEDVFDQHVYNEPSEAPAYAEIFDDHHYEEVKNLPHYANTNKSPTYDNVKKSPSNQPMVDISFYNNISSDAEVETLDALIDQELIKSNAPEKTNARKTPLKSTQINLPGATDKDSKA